MRLFEESARAKWDAAQEVSGAHRLFAGALHLGETHGALAASDGQVLVEDHAGHSATGGDDRAQDFDPLAFAVHLDLEPGAGMRREAANAVIDVAREQTPIDARLLRV